MNFMSIWIYSFKTFLPLYQIFPETDIFHIYLCTIFIYKRDLPFFFLYLMLFFQIIFGF